MEFCIRFTTRMPAGCSTLLVDQARRSAALANTMRIPTHNSNMSHPSPLVILLFLPIPLTTPT
jgi:hypothetical protein